MNKLVLWISLSLLLLIMGGLTLSQASNQVSVRSSINAKAFTMVFRKSSEIQLQIDRLRFRYNEGAESERIINPRAEPRPDFRDGELVCVVIRVEDRDSVLPSDCIPNATLLIEINPIDLFWWDGLATRSRRFTLGWYQDGGILDIYTCSDLVGEEQYPSCDFEFLYTPPQDAEPEDPPPNLCIETAPNPEAISSQTEISNSANITVESIQENISRGTTNQNEIKSQIDSLVRTIKIELIGNECIEQAEQVLSRLIALKDEFPAIVETQYLLDAYNLRGQVNAALGANCIEAVCQQANNQAIEDYTIYLQLNPYDEQAHYALARVYQAIGQYQAAVNSYQQSILNDSGDKYTWYYLGFAQLQLGLLSDAIASFSAAIEIDDQFIEALVARARVYLEVDYHAACINDYDSVINIYTAPEANLGEVPAYVYNNQAFCWSEGGYHQEAKQLYQLAYLNSPTNPTILSNQGLNFIELRDFACAVAKYTEMDDVIRIPNAAEPETEEVGRTANTEATPEQTPEITPAPSAEATPEQTPEMTPAATATPKQTPVMTPTPSTSADSDLDSRCGIKSETEDFILGDSPDVRGLVNIGRTYRLWGEFLEAEGLQAQRCHESLTCYEISIQKLSEALGINPVVDTTQPGSINVYVELALVHAALGKYETARDCLEGTCVTPNLISNPQEPLNLSEHETTIQVELYLTLAEVQSIEIKIAVTANNLQQAQDRAAVIIERLRNALSLEGITPSEQMSLYFSISDIYMDLFQLGCTECWDLAYAELDNPDEPLNSALELTSLTNFSRAQIHRKIAALFRVKGEGERVVERYVDFILPLAPTIASYRVETAKAYANLETFGAALVENETAICLQRYIPSWYVFKAETHILIGEFGDAARLLSYVTGQFTTTRPHYGEIEFLEQSPIAQCAKLGFGPDIEWVDPPQTQEPLPIEAFVTWAWLENELGNETALHSWIDQACAQDPFTATQIVRNFAERGLLEVSDGRYTSTFTCPGAIYSNLP